jgi:hypothetical protein
MCNVVGHPAGNAGSDPGGGGVAVGPGTVAVAVGAGVLEDVTVTEAALPFQFNRPLQPVWKRPTRTEYAPAALPAATFHVVGNVRSCPALNAWLSK